MIKFLRKDNLQIFWLVFHMALGFVSIQSKWPLIIWFYLLLFSFLISIFGKRAENGANAIYLLGYALGLEVLARGVGATPFIPHEMGKYLGVFGFTIALFLGGPIKRLSIYGVAMLFLSIPGILVMERYDRGALVFNYFGPLALFLGVIYCSKQIFTYKNMKELFRIMLYGIFALACFTIFRASQFEKIEYSLTANFDASGGSITNQVATLFGVAISLLALMFLSNQRMFKYRIIDYTLLSLFLVRGLLTFSRGGMISAVLAILAVIIFPKASARLQDNEVKMRSVPISTVLVVIGLMVGAFFYVNALTNNYLLYRYQGRTERSLQTGFRNELDANQWTSGRVHIWETDIKMFLANPSFGVGVGGSKLERVNYGGYYQSAAHIEMSRLLAEHGLPGFILVLMIFVYPFYLITREKNNYKRSIMLIFLVMGLSATFHNAMRTLVTPVLFSYCFITLVPSDYDWRQHFVRKRPYLKARRAVASPEPQTAG